MKKINEKFKKKILGLCLMAVLLIAILLTLFLKDKPGEYVPFEGTNQYFELAQSDSSSVVHSCDLLSALNADANYFFNKGIMEADTISIYEPSFNLRVVLIKGSEINSIGFEDGNLIYNILSYSTKPVIIVTVVNRSMSMKSFVYNLETNKVDFMSSDDMSTKNKQSALKIVGFMNGTINKWLTTRRNLLVAE